jgi:hypothetical protein
MLSCVREGEAQVNETIESISAHEQSPSSDLIRQLSCGIGAQSIDYIKEKVCEDNVLGLKSKTVRSKKEELIG